jgi:hypothetical protein
MEEDRLDALLAHGPTLRTLTELSSPAMNSAGGYCIMQALRPQLCIARMLATIRSFDTKRQGLVLVLCRRFLHPEKFPLWPARALMMKADTSLSAVRLVVCMPRSSQAVLLPTIATLSYNAAIDILYDLSELPMYAKSVASAVANTPYRPYMRMLGRPTLWYLVRYLRENDSGFALARLARDNPERAIRLGAVTHLIGAGKYVPAVNWNLLDWVASSCVHQNIRAMHAEGVACDLERAMRYEPKAVDAIATKWPQLGREVKWLRRRTFMMCTQAYSSGARALWHGLVHAEDIRKCVVGYM